MNTRSNIKQQCERNVRNSTRDSSTKNAPIMLIRKTWTSDKRITRDTKNFQAIPTTKPATYIKISTENLSI
jgi:hypothetical protein